MALKPDPIFSCSELQDDSITISLGAESTTSYDYTFGSSALTYSSDGNIITGGITVPWTTTTGISVLGDTYPNVWSNGDSAKIQLDGPDADIEINGESLIDMLRNIEQRLNILKPNPDLESEWAELRALGDQYRKLEQHIKDKQATWDKLKAMPPPDID